MHRRDVDAGRAAFPVCSIGGWGRRATASKGAGHCKRAASHASARHMLPTPLAPLDPNKTRALTTIYAPRKFKTRKNKTAQSRMLDNNIPVKTSLSPFLPLPAIGQKLERSNTKVIVFDLNKNESLKQSVKLQTVIKPLTPLRISGNVPSNPMENLEVKKPQQLLRENTYEVLEPVLVTAAYIKKNETPKMQSKQDKAKVERLKESPKTRFKKAALQVVKLSSMAETGKLLCLRERQTYNICQNENDKMLCKLEGIPRTPSQRLDKLSEIFQNLDINGQQRQRLKKENSWF